MTFAKSSLPPPHLLNNMLQEKESLAANPDVIKAVSVCLQVREKPCLSREKPLSLAFSPFLAFRKRSQTSSSFLVLAGWYENRTSGGGWCSRVPQ
jgi:hypothetical protein